MNNVARKSLLLTGLAVAGIATFNYFNGPPRPSHAGEADPMAGYVMLGIDNASGQLVRYRFSDDELTTLGTVTLTGGTVPTGIGAGAYIPGFSNLFAFWTDPSDGLTKLLYIQTRNGAASVVGQDLGPGKVGGAVAVKPAGEDNYKVYAVQNRTGIDFSISGDEVVGNETYAARVTVLGAAITYGGTYDIPVTLEVTVDGNTTEPFGPFDKPLDGNLNDGHTPVSYVLPGQYPSASSISLKARSWVKKLLQNGDKNSEWQTHMTVDSSPSSSLVYTLRDGDSVPNATPFMDQATIESYIQDYVDAGSGKVVLDPNQVIYLFELGNATGIAADFQDLVVLVTLGKDPTEVGMGSLVSDASVAGEIELDPNNSGSNEFTLVRTNGDTITREDLNSNSSVDASGTYFNGNAKMIRVNPTGADSQTTLTVNGEEFEVENDDVVVLTSSSMGAQVYNDSVDGSGHPVGNWRVAVDGNNVTVQADEVGPEADDVPVPAKLVEVDHKTGETTDLMDLARAYQSLASSDGETFYGVSGGKLYEINPTAQTEVLVGAIAGRDVQSMENAGGTLLGFDTTASQLVTIDADTAQVIGTATSLDVSSLGTIVFTPTAQDTSSQAVGFD